MTRTVATYMKVKSPLFGSGSFGDAASAGLASSFFASSFLASAEGAASFFSSFFSSAFGASAGFASSFLASAAAGAAWAKATPDIGAPATRVSDAANPNIINSFFIIFSPLLQRFSAGFTGANANYLFEFEDKNLAVTDLAGIG